MTEIKYHEPRLPDEEELYEVYFTKHGSRGEKHKGSIWFRICETTGLEEVACRLHGTRERKEYLPTAAKKLIREKNEPVIYDHDGNVIAELVVNEVQEVGDS